MLAIKLSRISKKKQPSYRLIVVEKHKDPKGDYLEKVGFYNPRTEPSTIELNTERIKYWIGQGAQPTDTVRNLLIDAKIIEGEKINTVTVSKKRQAKKTEADTAKQKKAAEEKAKEVKAEKPATEEVKPEAKPAEETKIEEQPKEKIKESSSATDKEQPAEKKAKEKKPEEK